MKKELFNKLCSIILIAKQICILPADATVTNYPAICWLFTQCNQENKFVHFLGEYIFILNHHAWSFTYLRDFFSKLNQGIVLKLHHLRTTLFFTRFILVQQPQRYVTIYNHSLNFRITEKNTHKIFRSWCFVQLYLPTYLYQILNIFYALWRDCVYIYSLDGTTR